MKKLFNKEINLFKDLKFENNIQRYNKDTCILHHPKYDYDEPDEESDEESDEELKCKCYLYPELNPNIKEQIIYFILDNLSIDIDNTNIFDQVTTFDNFLESELNQVLIRYFNLSIQQINNIISLISSNQQRIFAQSYRILRIMSGMRGLRYSS